MDLGILKQNIKISLNPMFSFTGQPRARRLRLIRRPTGSKTPFGQSPAGQQAFEQALSRRPADVIKHARAIVAWRARVSRATVTRRARVSRVETRAPHQLQLSGHARSTAADGQQQIAL